MRRLFWDYYGPRAGGTANHFRLHLDEFINDMKLTGCTSGVIEYSPTHAAAWCDAPEDACETLVSRLRPHRAD